MGIFTVKFLFYFSGNHVSHLKALPEEEINRLLGMVVDVENIFMSMHTEQDADTKKVYYFLFDVSYLVTFCYLKVM